MSYPKTGQEVYVSLNLSNTMLTGIGKGTITREEVSVDYLKRLFAEHGVIVSAKPEQHRLLEIVNATFDLGLELPEDLKLFQLSEQHRRLVVINVQGLRRKGGSLLPEYSEEEFGEVKNCKPAQIPYCITQALIRAVHGDVENGLVFCGSNVGKIDRISTVREVIEDLMYEKEVTGFSNEEKRRTQKKKSLCILW